MLADLHRIRDLQVLQRRALVDADGERLEALDVERMAVQSRLVPLRESGLHGDDLRAAERLVGEITTEQEALIRVASAVRDRLADELRGMHAGRAALTGYRVPARGESLYLDRAS